MCGNSNRDFIWRWKPVIKFLKQYFKVFKELVQEFLLDAIDCIDILVFPLSTLRNDSFVDCHQVMPLCEFSNENSGHCSKLLLQRLNSIQGKLRDSNSFCKDF